MQLLMRFYFRVPYRRKKMAIKKSMCSSLFDPMVQQYLCQTNKRHVGSQQNIKHLSFQCALISFPIKCSSLNCLVWKLWFGYLANFYENSHLFRKSMQYRIWYGWFKNITYRAVFTVKYFYITSDVLSLKGCLSSRVLGIMQIQCSSLGMCVLTF